MKWYFIIVALLGIAFFLLRCVKKEILVYPFKKANLLPDATELMNTINNYRNENGMTWLKADDTASMLEFDHVNYMIENGVSHDNLNDRRSELSLQGAENIEEVVCGNYTTLQGAFLGFMNSPKHDRALLNRSVNTCGISVRKNSEGKYYIAIILFNS